MKYIYFELLLLILHLYEIVIGSKTILLYLSLTKKIINFYTAGNTIRTSYFGKSTRTVLEVSIYIYFFSFQGHVGGWVGTTHTLEVATCDAEAPKR